MQPLISIIVPIYKVEKYLRRCIDSIIAQTFKDWELILVDDGSPDNSGAICDEYASKDERIRVIHKANGRVSAARNDGMKAAKGEWITFVDGDDFVSSTFIEELYAPITNDPTLTFVHGGCVNYFDDGQTTINQKYDGYVGDDKSFVFENFRGLVVSKLFKREILEKQSILFDTRIKIAEDYIFTLEYLFHVDRYAFVEGIGYYYYMREGSATKYNKRPAFNDGMWLGPKIEADLTEKFIEEFKPSKQSADIRKNYAGQVMAAMLSLYYLHLPVSKRRSVFSNFWNKKYRDMLKSAEVSFLRKILVMGLFSRCTFHINDALLSICIK